MPDLEVARLFYGEGLGLCADQDRTGAQRGGVHVMWYNVGRQQVGGSVGGWGSTSGRGGGADAHVGWWKLPSVAHTEHVLL